MLILRFFCVRQLLVLIEGKAEPKIESTLALSLYFWQFCTGEWWNY